jgi:hypothetical protein
MIVSAALLFAVAGPASTTEAAVVICQKGKKLRLRENACKKAEQTIDASELGVTGPQGPAGADGAEGPPGPFADGLPSGKTVRGHFNIGGNGTGAGSLANTALSFDFALDAAPTAHIIQTGDPAPPECTGSATFPEAAPGHLCVYENADTSNRTSLMLNEVNRSGATIFITSTAGGNYYSYGSWAVTAP